MQSIWAATAVSTAAPSLSGDLVADVVVLGAGLSGLTAAFLLGEAGRRVVVLESGRVGLGTTGHSTGNLYVCADESLSLLRRKWGPEIVRQVVLSRASALRWMRETVERLGLGCDLVPAAFHWYSEEGAQKAIDLLDEEADVARDCGLEPHRGTDLGLPFPIRDGLRIPGQAQLHPLKYVQGLAANLGPSCHVFEKSAVVEIDDGAGVVRTAGGSVRAEHIVMATHTPKGIHGVQLRLAPVREFGVAAPLGRTALGAGIYWRADEPKRSIRVWLDGAYAWVLAVGEAFKTGRNEHTAQSVQALEDYLASRFAPGPARYRWGGQAYRSADGLPYVGREDERTWILTGYATDGLVYGTLAARLVADGILGRENPWTEMYRLDRLSPLRSAGRVLHEAADNLGRYLRDLPGVSEAAAPEDVPAGEGRLVRVDGEELAVHRDRAGVLHVLSAVCTHRKCIVRWNEAESSWDCPCHGSRFGVDGDVLEGPALAPLEKKGA